MLRLWHKDLIDVLPDKFLDKMLKDIWVIYNKKPGNTPINYVYTRKGSVDLKYYTLMVIREYTERGYKLNKGIKYLEKMWGIDIKEYLATHEDTVRVFEEFHNMGYLIYCFYMLAEDYNYGVSGIGDEEYELIYERVVSLVPEELLVL